MTALKLTLFAIFWFAAAYGFNCILARKFKKIDLKYAALYITSLGMLGVFGEVLVGQLYNFLFDKPLWLYHVLPIHSGYTSSYAPVIWGGLGFHLYLLHGTLSARKRRSLNQLALFFAGETLIVEILGNYTYKVAFHDYIFYYFPNDLWHLTSIQTLPFYLAAGFVTIFTISKLKTDPIFFSCMALGLASVLVFLV